MEKSYKYLGYFFLLLIPLIFAGFYRSYFEPFPNFDKKIDVFAHIHGALASIWILMLMVQPFLILKKKYSLHRKIGRLSYIIFPLLVLSFIPQIIKVINTEDLAYLFFPVSDGILLIVFYSLAIYNRKNTPMHMRYMIVTAVIFLGPTIGRIGPTLLGWTELFTQNVQYAIIYSILLSLVLYDRSNRKKFTPYLVAIVGYVFHQSAYYLVFQ